LEVGRFLADFLDEVLAFFWDEEHVSVGWALGNIQRIFWEQIIIFC
jgi:hypothetical protein